jgi:hypothetical protein
MEMLAFPARPYGAANEGIRKRPSLRAWERDVEGLRTGDGRVLPPLLRIEIDRLRRRLVLILELIRELEIDRAHAEEAVEAADRMTGKITALRRVRGTGPNGFSVLGPRRGFLKISHPGSWMRTCEMYTAPFW